MKYYWLITLAVSLLWMATVFGITYLHTGFQNDALDEKYGQIAGSGAVVIWMVAAVLWLKKKKG